MNTSSQKLAQCVEAVKAKWPGTPEVGLILGSGLGGLSRLIQPEAIFGSGEIPHYPGSTAIGHRGRFLCGQLNGVCVVVMEGRTHLYEGKPASDIALPLRLMIQLGAGTVVITSASGGVNPEFLTGDVVILRDHINLMWRNPLAGKNDDSLGPRFPDMSSPYDSNLALAGQSSAREAGFSTRSGVYLGLAGPNYETSAEYRMARLLGADVVGMSTVPEVLAARHAGARVFAASVVSNVYTPEAGPVHGEEVVDVVAQSEPVMRAVIAGVLKEAQSGSTRAGRMMSD